MDLNTWLDAADGKGRLTCLATHFGVTSSAISQWRTKGVPPGRMKAVRDFTEGAVTLDEMLPSPPMDIGAVQTSTTNAAAA